MPPTELRLLVTENIIFEHFLKSFLELAFELREGNLSLSMWWTSSYLLMVPMRQNGKGEI